MRNLQEQVKKELEQFVLSNSERSEQFLVTQRFFLTSSWRFARSNKLHRTIRIQIGKNYWDLETCS
jgi:hypothetical protein